MRLLIGYFLAFFSVAILFYLGLFYFGDLLSIKNDGINHFFYPQKTGAIVFEFFIFLLLLISSTGLILNNKRLSCILPIPIFFLLVISIIFITLEGSYAYFSKVQTKLIGCFFLFFSAGLSFFIWRYLYVICEKKHAKNKKVIVFGVKFIVSCILLVLWVLLNKH